MQQFSSAPAYQTGHQGPFVNIQYRQQQVPMGQQLQQEVPQPQQAIIVPQQTVTVIRGSRNSVQPRVNFSGGSVNSSFEQGRNVTGLQPPLNQVKFGQSLARGPAHPGHQMGMNLSR